MSTTSLIIRNYKACLNKDGTALIFVRYSHKGKFAIFGIGESILPKYWDQKNQKVKKSYDGCDKLNAYLHKRKEKIDDIVRYALFDDVEPTVSFVKNTLFGQKSSNGNIDLINDTR